jgi:hypothetical protein
MRKNLKELSKLCNGLPKFTITSIQKLRQNERNQIEEESFSKKDFDHMFGKPTFNPFTYDVVSDILD